jgi:choline dehydrogenase-like flavoprotein
MNLNLKAKAQQTYDAIVIGSGISGGWAAKELTEKGLQTLVLERGRNVEHIKDYPTATLAPWELRHRGRLPREVLERNPVASRCYAYNETTAHFFVEEKEHPYTAEKPYDWIRAYQVGGKSLLWARMTQRWGEHDFEANAQDGVGADWPIRYADIAPWYSYVEKFAGISGNRDGLPQVPDGEFLPPFEMNCVEKYMKQQIETRYPGRNLIINRTANLTQAQRIHQTVGRTNCQARNMCAKGCPFGGYFSSNSATLPAAQATGRLTLRPDAVVHSIIYDEQQGRATGVRVVDAHTKEMTEYSARIIFVNANTLNTARLLLNSTSSRFPNGLGNDSGVLGHYLIGHNYRGRVSGVYEGFKDQYYYGRRPTSTYVPRFRNFGKDKQKDFLRGYAYSGFGSRSEWGRGAGGPDFGADFKESLTQPGPWQFSLNGMGEFLPRYENHARLNPDQVDAWGVPSLTISCDYGPNEEAMLKDIMATAAEMMESAGLKVTSIRDTKQSPGNENHEMGTARMGKDPKTSILNKWNQMHAVPNVFVTDGACMASSACQNPSLTYMALTTRAADHAVQELKRMNL